LKIFLKIEVLEMFPKAEIQPIIFQEIYILTNKEKESEALL